MEKIRIGNDIVVLWAIRAEQDGEKVPYDLTGRKLSLYVSNQIESWKVQDFEINGSALRWMFCGKDQKHVGTYTLTLVENEGEEEMHTVDMCNAFRLVPRTCQNEEEENDVIELVTLEFLSDFFVQEPLEKIDVDTELSIESENPVENRVITEKFDEIEKSLEKKADSSTLAKVAKSGSYNDLSNKPTIPTKVSQLTNDKNYASQSKVDDLRSEILGDLEADDAETIKDINVEITELYRQIDTINDAGYVNIGDVQTEIGKLGGSASDTQNGLVDVTVTTTGGQVKSVDVGVTGLDTALAGKANLDESGKILASELPDYILGQVMFGGIITKAYSSTVSVQPTDNFKEKYNLTGSSVIINTYDYSKYEGVYFIASGSLVNATALGVANVNVGDWVISTGSEWAKVDNTDAVASVAGLTGSITASALAKKLAETDDANELALKSELNNKQDKLVSGTNIKTINGNSILGSGDIVIEGGGGGSTVQPDWNAMKGEAGYIENKPFILRHGYEGDEVTKDILEQYKLNLDEFEEYTFVGEYEEGFTGLRKEIDGYGFLNQILHNVHNVSAGYVDKGNFILENGSGGEIAFGDYGKVIFNEEDIDDKRYITINWYNDYQAIDELPNFDVYIIPDWDPFFMDTLPSELLPDTVVKTTRQYLSDSAKNQVKENLGISFSTPDWNAQEGQDGYIKNRTHYVTEISIGTSEYTYLEGIPTRCDHDSGIYYAEKEIHVQYREDDYIGIIKIPANTPLGYEGDTTPVTVIGDDNGEEFTFSSHSGDGDIFFKVERPNFGTDFRVLLYTPLEETYIPDSILNGGYLYSNGEKIDMRFTRSLLPTGTRIPASANLNTIEFLKIGKYYCSLNADAKTIKNCPVNVEFSMEVFNPLGTNVDDETTNDYTYRLRVLTQYDTGQQYVQFCRTNGTARSWIYDSWYVTPRAKFALASSKNDGSAAIGANNKGVYIDSTGEIKAMSYTIAKNVPSNAVFTDTDTKVTAVGNHYAPAEDSTQQIDAPSGEVVTGIKRDAAGHVVGVVSAPQTGGGGGTGEGSDNVYITDFKVVDFEYLKEGEIESLQIDPVALSEAIIAKKTILVPYDDGYVGGYGLLLGEVEDTNIYFSIYSYIGQYIYAEAYDGVVFASPTIIRYLEIEPVQQTNLDALKRVAVANAVQTDGLLYAFPDQATGEEDEVLLSRGKVKSINGQNLLVDENSNDITVAYPEKMATSTAMILQPNTVTSWGGSVAGTIQIAFAPSPQGHVSEYIARFTVGSDGTQLIVPDNVVWADGVLPAMTEGKTYEISFMDGYATFLEF